jgi:hypothetical protein
MERRYVDFPIAKLLKEKGFDVECSSYYVNRDKYDEESAHKRLTTNGLMCDIPAPEIWQVVEFLKTKYGIWVHVECESSGLVWFPKVNICSDESWKNEEIRDVVYLVNGKLKTKWFKSDQEAYQAAFKHALEELI